MYGVSNLSRADYMVTVLLKMGLDPGCGFRALSRILKWDGELDMRALLAIFGILFLISSASAQEFALDAPGAVGMRDTIDVGWTAPQTKGGIIEIRPTGENARRVAYAYANKNPQPVEAPEAPGDYVLVFYFDGEDRVSQPLRVEPSTATLKAASKSDAGAAVIVIWVGPKNRNDHVTFALAGGAPIRGASYAYVGNSRDGTVNVKAPQDPASYDIVYVSGSTVLARIPITVGGIAATLAFPAKVPAGSGLTVTFEGPENNGDYITFAARDGEPIKPASYAYASQAKNGGVPLRAFEETGGYDIVYVSGRRVIGRGPIEIVPVAMEIDAPDEVPALLTFETKWRGQGNGGDLIFMVEPGQSQGRLYRYIDPSVDTVVMAAPVDEGHYELVYITRGGKELARRAITVTPAAVDPGQIEVLLMPGAGLGPDDAVEVILDASGSMLQRQDGERRIEIAKRTLSGLVTDTIPEGVGFAMRVFGNREADACRTDLEIALGPHDAGTATAVIGGINAVNLAKTPIAQSVSLATEDLAGVSGSRVLILITDGEETCDGDPGQAIEALRAGGWDIRINIIGYAIDDADLARTFESWAAAGGGEYFDAANGDQLSAALLRATAAPFEIVTEDGALVGAGLTGDEPLTVPAGAYIVHTGGKELAAEVKPRERTSVTP